MPRIEVKPSAIADLDDIVEKLYSLRPRTALKFYQSVWLTYQWLSRVPLGGSLFPQFEDTSYATMRFCKVKSFKNYIIFYMPQENGITVYHVVDGRRDYMKELFAIA
ncbi:MAG: type II toxin-antitoxin system RelE/ParE family toxin [Gemmatales bacterium]